MMQESFTFNDGASSHFTGIAKLGLSAEGLFAILIVVCTYVVYCLSLVTLDASMKSAAVINRF